MLVINNNLSCFCRLDLFSTEEGPESEDNTYLGYSLTLGHFDGGIVIIIMNMMSCHDNDGDDDNDNDDDDDDDKNRKRHSDLAPGDSYPDIAIGMPRGANLTGKVTNIIVTKSSS